MTKNNIYKSSIFTLKVEKQENEYIVFFEDEKGNREFISWKSHNVYGKKLSDGGNIKANNSGYWRDCLRMWEPNSILKTYEMEVVDRDGWGKAWNWEVKIEEKQFNRLFETKKNDYELELKKLERKQKKLQSKGTNENEIWDVEFQVENLKQSLNRLSY